MRRLLRVRPLAFAITAVALGAVIFSAHRATRAFLRTRLEPLLSPAELARLLADQAEALVVPAAIAFVLAAGIAYLAGAAIARPLRKLRRELLRRETGDATPLDHPALYELHALAAAIETQNRAVRENAARADRERDEFSALIATVSEGILQVSPDGRIVLANPAARELLGLPPDSRGQPLATLVRHAELRILLERAAAGTEINSREVALDERRVLVAARPLPPDRGQGGGGIVVALADLTELRRLEEVRRDFVANVSHELKTPLTAIRGYVETVLADELSAETRRQFLEVVQRNAERLQRIVDDLLDLSRLESGGWRPELRPVDAHAVAREVAAAFRPQAERKAIELRVTGGGALAIADPAGLRQVLSNLLDNAIRYTPERGRISLHAERGADGRVHLDVADNGAGIPGDALPRIFERFYRVDPARSRADGGTGLGLSIVKHLVDRMGGTASAQSELGKGTTIRVALPGA